MLHVAYSVRIRKSLENVFVPIGFRLVWQLPGAYGELLFSAVVPDSIHAAGTRLWNKLSSNILS